MAAEGGVSRRLGRLDGPERISEVVNAVDAGELSAPQALGRVRDSDVEMILHGRGEAGTGAARRRRLLGRGTAASPGAGTGRAYFSADSAADAADRDEPVILVLVETSPADVHGMASAAAIVTARGGISSHAAVVARGWGTPAVVGLADLAVGPHEARFGAEVVAEGQQLVVDGHTGEVFALTDEGEDADEAEAGSDRGAGERSGGTVDALPTDLARLLDWADEVTAGRVAVRANADTAGDAARAKTFGAQGIGLCRTEHMFLEASRLALVRRAILSDDPAAADALRDAQRRDFIALLEAMVGWPVTVRLLDPPLHEFLPPLPEVHDPGERQAVERWQEHNPMLGTRGVRLGMVKPLLYKVQIEALLSAVMARRRAGAHPEVSVLVPMVMAPAEVDVVRRWVREGAARVGLDPPPAVGAMVETPRAALLADQLAASADFLSFGTNDLTQLTFGLSRDDAAATLMPTYLDRGLLDVDPFVTLDPASVGSLVAAAVRAARATAPGIACGACGEHAGDPASIRTLVAAGVDSLSCSPFRVPGARLAAAQAILDGP